MQKQTPAPTLYQVLQVHPAAPPDLITAAYWRLTAEVQARRAAGPQAESTLYHLTRAYQTLINPGVREAYDAEIGLRRPPPIPQVSRRRRQGLFASKPSALTQDANEDYYAILRVTPDAWLPVVREAYETMRNHYLRLVQSQKAPVRLVTSLEDAYYVISDPARRSEYDAQRLSGGSHTSVAIAHPVQEPAPAELEPMPVGDLKPQPAPNEGRKNGRRGKQPKEERRPPAPKAESKRNLKRKEPSTNGDRRQPLTAASAVMTASAGAVAGAAVRVRPRLTHTVKLLAGSSAEALSVMREQISSLSKREAERMQSVVTQRAQAHLSAGSRRRARAAEAEEEFLRRLSETVHEKDAPPPRASHRPLARLTLLEGPGRGATFDLRRFPVTLGSDRGADIVLPGLDSQRARLDYRSRRFIVYNAAQVNGSQPAQRDWPCAVVDSGEDLILGPYRLRLTTVMLEQQ